MTEPAGPRVRLRLKAARVRLPPRERAGPLGRPRAKDLVQRPAGRSATEPAGPRAGRAPMGPAGAEAVRSAPEPVEAARAPGPSGAMGPAVLKRVQATEALASSEGRGRDPTRAGIDERPPVPGAGPGMRHRHVRRAGGAATGPLNDRESAAPGPRGPVRIAPRPQGQLRIAPGPRGRPRTAPGPPGPDRTAHRPRTAPGRPGPDRRIALRPRGRPRIAPGPRGPDHRIALRPRGRPRTAPAPLGLDRITGPRGAPGFPRPTATAWPTGPGRAGRGRADPVSRTRSSPRSSTPRYAPSCIACRTTWPTPWPVSWSPREWPKIQRKVTSTPRPRGASRPG